MKINKIKFVIKNTIFFIILFSLTSSQAISLIVTNKTHIIENKVNMNNYDVMFFQNDFRAVLIGINDYPGTSGDLPYSVNEINSFKKTLINKGNWNESQIKMIIDQEANHDNIIDSLEWLAEQETNKDISIIYFVGHGGKIDNNYSFSAYDSKIYDYELDTIFDTYEGRIVLIMDCCKSGGFTETVKGRGRMIMAACDKDELTYQYKQLKSGFFGYFLNLTLEKFTYTAEATFLIAAPLTYFYSLKISNELGKDYIVKPKASDSTIRTIRLIRPRFLDLFFKESSIELIQPLTKFDDKEIWLL